MKQRLFYSLKVLEITCIGINDIRVQLYCYDREQTGERLAHSTGNWLEEGF